MTPKKTIAKPLDDEKTGWITIHRKILKHWIFQDADYFKWWVYFLMRANHKETSVLINKIVTTVSRGEFITSSIKLSEELKTTRQKVRTFLKLLNLDQMINQQTTSKLTKISICNYDTYQHVQPACNQQVNQQPTSSQPAANQQITTDNNVNNVNNEKNDNNNTTNQENLNEWGEEYFKIKVSEITGFTDKEKNEFTEYWTERTPKGKMRFQLEKTWDTKRRIARAKRFGFIGKEVEPEEVPFHIRMANEHVARGEW